MPKYNKPEKLELPEIPKIHQGKKDSLSAQRLPLRVQLQRLKFDAENQIFERLFSSRKNFKL